jgi:glutamate/tyrosine decarboxylase-like PLP-dependent enzyme
MPLLERDSLAALTAALDRLESGFAHLPVNDAARPSDAAMLQRVLAEVANRLHDNYPYFHPLYAGQMLKPPHPVARAAYALATWINPNNHARDGGRASSEMEIEAVREIAAMFGFEHAFLGHLTSSGTFANLEALWVSGQVAPGKTILASEQAHYTHARISAVLKLPFETVAVDARGRMDVAALEARLRLGDIATVVATLGTTACGAVDPLHEILPLARRYGARVHVDSAYGGYFTLVTHLDEDVRAAYDSISQADSVVIDPHKHGLQPYGCGCILFRDASVGRFYKHDSPYTYFTSDQLHLGEISLECSRAGAAAVALWATQRALPLKRGGEFAQQLLDCRTAAAHLHSRISASERFVAPFAPQLDIVVWAVRTTNVEASSRLAQEIFERAAELDLHLALVDLPVKFFPSATLPQATTDRITCLRSVLMKPEHNLWIDSIWQRLLDASNIS